MVRRDRPGAARELEADGAEHLHIRGQVLRQQFAVRKMHFEFWILFVVVYV